MKSLSNKCWGGNSTPLQKGFTMIKVKYTQSPIGVFIGYISKLGQVHFMSGDTKEKLRMNAIKTGRLYYDTENVELENTMTRTDAFPYHLMPKRLISQWWRGFNESGKPTKRHGGFNSKEVMDRRKKLSKVKPEPIPEFAFHITRRIGNKMFVFGCKPIAEYDLEEEQLPDINAKTSNDSLTEFSLDD